MPVININGTVKNCSWNQIMSFANSLEISPPDFVNIYGPPPNQNQMYHNPTIAVTPTIATHNLWEAAAFATVPQAQAAPDDDVITHTENVAQEFHAQLDDIVSIFNAKPRATKTVDTTNTGKLLQEVYKYKAMTLRKADSIAYEKTNTLKNKPFD